jgi:HEXXH motif-containing protein
VAIQKIMQNYLEQPLPLWENEITQLLVDYKWAALVKQSQITPNTYSIAGCVQKDNSIIEANLSLPVTEGNIKIELPSADLNGFYEKHGIEPVEITSIESDDEITKINSALSVLKQIEPVHDFILKIVQSVQLIKAEYPDTDVSYSHPEIPFSIFFSVCEEVSTISDLRVAESILHEAMHLKLTLIETHVDLIEPNSKEIYYSPWRDENRPLRGVLHGLFVFRAILDFYTILLKKPFTKEINQYLLGRISEIKGEINLIKAFSQSNGLTTSGQKLSFKLLQ